jgi:choice-of-anchor A domain-containing protein
MRSVLKLLAATALICATNAWAGFTADPTYQDTLPDGSINVGRASRFTVLTYGDLNQYDNTVTGPSLIQGNVGIGGNGNFSMSDGTLNGDLYYHTGAKITFSGPAQHNGTKFANADAIINPALMDAYSLSVKAANDVSTTTYTVTQGTFNGTTENGNKDVTLFGGPGKIVLNLQDFVMTGGTFTLSGTAMTTYIINVGRNFSLNNSSIVLSGGVMPSHVLFNIKGTGSQVSLNQGTSMKGILLAAQRKVDLSGGKVFGRVFANQANITSGGQVVSE